MLFEQPLALEYLKPHKPLVRPAITNITNHIHTLFNNNLKFNYTIHMKNKMLSPSVIPLVRTTTVDMAAYYTQMPLEQYGLGLSDYEWFLHTSRLKEVYRKQKQFVRIMQRRQDGQSNFLNIFEGNTNFDVQAPLSWNPDHMTPTIYYVTQKKDRPSQPASTNTTRTETTVQNTAHEHTQSQVTVESNTLSSVNIDAIVDRVTKTMAEKLNLERLKKGR